MKKLLITAASALFLVAAGYFGTVFLTAQAQERGFVPGTGMIFPYPLIFQSGVKVAQSTVAGLPTCNAARKGQIRGVTDATTPTYNGALTGGGAVAVPVYCSGAAWLSH